MSSRRRGGPDGIAIVDKPTGWTSHDVVARVRSLLGTRRVGHAGTLDPMATGVLVLGVGRGTRLLTFVTGVDKAYDATIRFGVETDSLDADGDVVARHDMDGLDPVAVRREAQQLSGDLDQVPPMVSAIRIDGRRLHELAREGVEVDRPPRRVHVERFEVTPGDDPLLWHAEIECSSGTYVRSLAADLGRALGGGAHLASLRRTRVGPFHLHEARPMEALELLPLVEGIRHLPSTSLDERTTEAVRHGRVLPVEQLGVSGDGPWGVLGPDAELLAVYQRHRGDSAKPAAVLVATGAD